MHKKDAMLRKHPNIRCVFSVQYTLGVLQNMKHIYLGVLKVLRSDITHYTWFL